MTSPQSPTAWRAHPARWGVLGVGILLGCLGLVVGRADVTLLGVPLVLVGLWTVPLPRSVNNVALTPEADGLVLDCPTDTQAVRVRVTCEGHRPATVLVNARTARADIGLHSVRTGPQPLLRVDWDAHASFLMSATPPATVVSDPIVVLPRYLPLEQVPEARRVRGLTGPMTSRRAGEGFEWRDVHPMTPDDSTRRIDWRVTARQPRQDSWWVRGTYGMGEAIAVLVLDSRDEVGPDLNTWSGWAPLRVDEPTSLDLARHAAASIARRLIDAGDRVGLADLATGRRLLTPAAGRRQLNRLTYALALSAPLDTPRRRVRPPQVPTDALVYLFTTLLDDEPVRLVHALAERGHQVVVVDTLPEVRPAPAINMELAWRITAAERAARIARLGAGHVPVIRWAGSERLQADHQLGLIRRSWQRPEVR